MSTHPYAELFTHRHKQGRPHREDRVERWLQRLRCQHERRDCPFPDAWTVCVEYTNHSLDAYFREHPG